MAHQPSTTSSSSSSTIHSPTPSEWPQDSESSSRDEVASISEIDVGPPFVPNNTPATPSQDGTATPLGHSQQLDISALHTNLARIPGAQQPSQSTSSGENAEGKAHLRGPMRSELPLLNQLFKAAPSKPAKGGSSRKKGKVVTRRGGLGTEVPEEESENRGRDGGPSPPEEHVHEGNTWMQVAVEDLENALKRLTQAARDIQRQDDSRPVEQVYSEKLAEVIKRGKMAFDRKALE